MKKKYVDILKRDDFICQECGRYTEHKPHHIFYGIEKKFSDKYPECMITLCYKCHYKLHNQDSQLSLKWKQYAQRLFEEKYSKEKFIQECGRSYL